MSLFGGFGFGFSFKKKKNLTKGEVTASKPVSSGYRAPHDRSVYFHHEDRPRFSLLAAEYMRFDPKVTLSLATRNGLLLNAKIKVEADRKDVKFFIEKQWEKMWSKAGSQILRTKNVGYAGFEVMFKQQDRGPFAGKIVFDSLRDFAPRDTRPLIRQSKVVGITLRRIRDRRSHAVIGDRGGRGKPIWSPKSLWLTFRNRHGNWFGESLLEHAYAPWFEKWMRGGAIKLRQLRMIKDAWTGDRILYPSQGIEDAEGNIVNARDLAREIVEMKMSGGVITLPSDRDAEGNLKFEYISATSVDGATQIFEYSNELDGEIMEGLEMPSEIIEAGGTGSGFSGRSIPFVSFLAILHEEFADYVEQIDEQVMESLVRMNFGSDTFYTMTPDSLIERISELMGDGESSGAGGGKPGQFGGGMNPGEIGQGQRAGQSPGNGFETSRGSQFDPKRDALFAGTKQFSDLPTNGNGAISGNNRLSFLFQGPQTEGYKAGAIPTAGLRTDIVQGELIYQFAEDIPIGAKWITIGGGSDGSGAQHVGGSPALIDGDGTILKGPKWAADAGITKVGGSSGTEEKRREAGEEDRQQREEASRAKFRELMGGKKEEVSKRDDDLAELTLHPEKISTDPVSDVIGEIQERIGGDDLSSDQMIEKLMDEWEENAKLRDQFGNKKTLFADAVKDHFSGQETGTDDVGDEPRISNEEQKLRERFRELQGQAEEPADRDADLTEFSVREPAQGSEKQEKALRERKLSPKEQDERDARIEALIKSETLKIEERKKVRKKTEQTL